MKCLLKYQWVKLPRACRPKGKGVLGYWLRLASRAAFRKGEAKYCGYKNTVSPGMWAGGIVGLKSILGIKSRSEALHILDVLQELGYIRYSLDLKTKKAGIPDIRLGGSVQRRGMYEWCRLCDRGIWVPLSPPQISLRDSRIHITYTRKQTHGWTYGATQYGRIHAMRFLIWRRPFNTGSMVPF